MELKTLHHIINTHLNEGSLAEAHYSDEIFESSVIVEHPANKDASCIVITKIMGCWHLEYEKQKGGGVSIEMDIEISEHNDDIDEIIKFVNSHTSSEVLQPMTEEQKN